MRDGTRRIVQVVCGSWLLGATGVVYWMAIAISRNGSEPFHGWNSLYDYLGVGGVVCSCLGLGVVAGKPRKSSRGVVVALGVCLLAMGLGGHFGFKLLSADLLARIPPRKQLKSGAAETVLGYHYVCPTLGGHVAFGDGSVKFVSKDQFVTLRRADNPDFTPKFVSPFKEPPTEASSRSLDERGDVSQMSRAQERMSHSNNLKRMAVDHFRFQPRDNIRAPLKPEDFRSYPGMSEDLKNAISDGTYVWYFGWEPTIAHTTEKTKALWYDFASWASIYVAGLGFGAVVAGVALAKSHSKPVLMAGDEPN